MLLSRLPLVRLFQALLGLMAPEYFDKLVPCLEAGEGPRPGGPSLWSARCLPGPDRLPLSAVCNEIDQWPAPVPGQTLNLPVLGVVLQVRCWGMVAAEPSDGWPTLTHLSTSLASQVHIPARVDKPDCSPGEQQGKEVSSS